MQQFHRGRPRGIYRTGESRSINPFCPARCTDVYEKVECEAVTCCASYYHQMALCHSTEQNILHMRILHMTTRWCYNT